MVRVAHGLCLGWLALGVGFTCTATPNVADSFGVPGGEDDDNGTGVPSSTGGQGGISASATTSVTGASSGPTTSDSDPVGTADETSAPSDSSSADATSSTTATTSTGTTGTTTTGTTATGGATTAVTCQDPLGEMADCANGSTSVCGTQTCVGDAFPNPSFAVCAPGCNQLCDCPDPPAGGTATLECGPFDTSGANQCYLDCSGGASCPDEMFCLYNQWCTWRSDDLPCGAMQGSYGGCVVDGAIDDSLCTAPGEACIANSLTAPTWGFCSVLGCADTSCDCPAAPGGTAVATCGPILTNNNRACYLPCTDPSQCPAGMSCQSGLCVHLDTP